jgi:mannose-1-phosphate guanylyltransferase
MAFVEKPSAEEAVANTINAGAYLLELSTLDSVPEGQPCSIEREVFPQLVKTGSVWGYPCPNYWIDYGTVGKYFEIHLDILDGKTAVVPAGLKKDGGLFVEKSVKIEKGLRVEGAGWKAVGAGARLGAGVSLVGRVCVGPKAVIGPGARLQDCVVLEGARVPAGENLKGSVYWRGKLSKVAKI